MSAPETRTVRRSHAFDALTTTSAGLFAIVAVFIVLALIYSVVNPIFEAPDEYQHFFTARHLAQGRGFARPDATEPWLQEAAQPPLYYLLTGALIARIDTSNAEALLWTNEHSATGFPTSFGNKNQIVHTDTERWPYRQTVLAIHIARLFSILLGAIVVVLIHAIARLLIPSAPRIALAAAALTAFSPQFVFVSASVSNDNLTNATAALAAFLLLLGLRRTRPRGWAMALGVALGLVALSKASGLLFWPLAGLTILLVGWRRGQLRGAFLDCLVIFALAGAIATWWYARNWLLYGDPTGVRTIVSILGRRVGRVGFRELLGELRGLRFSYWGMFGWWNVLSPIWMYRAANYLTVLALVGLPLALVPHFFGDRTGLVRRDDLPWLLVPAAWLAIVILSLLQYDRLLPALQGRLLMPASWGLNLFLVLGWAGLVLAVRWLLRDAGHQPRRLVSDLFAATPLGLLAAWALTAPFAIIAPAYASPERVTPDQVPVTAQRTPVYHGPYVRFLGGAVAPAIVRPGEDLRTTVYWESLTSFPVDYTAFVHALTPDGRSVADSNTWPGRGNYPTRLWKPGEVVVDEQRITIPWDADKHAPTLLMLDAGFFIYSSNSLLESHAADGSPARSLVDQVRLLPSKPSEFRPATLLPAQFGNAIRLLGYTLTPPAAIKAGEPVTLTLYWNSTAAIQEDWTVFVHLRPKSGAPQLGWDRPPRDGAWPTSAWQPGYPVEDTHHLDLTADAPIGPAELWIGLYRADGRRLPITETMASMQDNGLHLQDVLLRP